MVAVAYIIEHTNKKMSSYEKSNKVLDLIIVGGSILGAVAFILHFSNGPKQRVSLLSAVIKMVPG